MACRLICKQLKSHKGNELIYVEEVTKGQWAPTVCMHCQQAPCEQVCPSKAIVTTPEGIVKPPDESKCLACSNCVLVCPFGVATLAENKKIMVKCDLCPERTAKGLLPYCAVICPTGTIRYEESVDSSLKRRTEAVGRILKAVPTGRLQVE
jgi:Fe-S-cluster-containing dehydrogenase component